MCNSEVNNLNNSSQHSDCSSPKFNIDEHLQLLQPNFNCRQQEVSNHSTVNTMSQNSNRSNNTDVDSYDEACKIPDFQLGQRSQFSQSSMQSMQSFECLTSSQSFDGLNAQHILNQTYVHDPSMLVGAGKGDTSEESDVEQNLQESETEKSDTAEVNELIDTDQEDVDLLEDVSEQNALNAVVSRIDFKFKEKLSLLNLFAEKDSHLKTVLSGKIHNKESIKFNMVVEVDYEKSELNLQDGNVDKTVHSFLACGNQTVINVEQLDELLADAYRIITLRSEQFMEEKSGFTLKRITGLHVNVGVFSPLAASGYIELPQCIKLKKAVVNIKNRDNR